MQENVGSTDRLLRIGIGASLATAGLLRLRSGRLGPVLLFASGALLLQSALTRVCPVKSLLGIDTRKGRAFAENANADPRDPLPQTDAPITVFPRRSE